MIARALALAGALLPVACGGPEAQLLRAADADEIIYSRASATNYRPSSTDPADFGSIRGRVVFEGDPWRERKIALSDDFCIEAHDGGVLQAEDFLLGPENGLANVVVFIRSGLQTMQFEPPSEPVVLDQVDCRYVPHVAVLRIGQPLVIESSDNTLHNVHAAAGANDGFNVSMSKPGRLAPKVFYKTEVAKLIGCDVHSWMKSYVAVLPHPCWAISGEDGSFAIEGVPPGRYELAVWHERFPDAPQTFAVDVELQPNEEKTQDMVLKRS